MREEEGRSERQVRDQCTVPNSPELPLEAVYTNQGQKPSEENPKAEEDGHHGGDSEANDDDTDSHLAHITLRQASEERGQPRRATVGGRGDRGERRGEREGRGGQPRARRRVKFHFCDRY